MAAENPGSGTQLATSRQRRIYLSVAKTIKSPLRFWNEESCLRGLNETMGGVDQGRLRIPTLLLDPAGGTLRPKNTNKLS